MKKIMTIFSGIILAIACMILLPAGVVKADVMSITGVSIDESSVDVSSGTETLTVRVGVSVTSPETINTISVRLECMNGSGPALTGTVTPGTVGTGTYAVTVTVPTSAYGRYAVMTVGATGSDGGNAFSGSYVGMDSVYVVNDNVYGYGYGYGYYGYEPTYYMAGNVDTDWVNLAGGKYLRVKVSAFEDAYYNMVTSISATFVAENGEKLEVNNFSRSMQGFFYALVKETDIKKLGRYDLKQVIIHDTNGNEALYYYPDKTVTFNGNVTRSFPARLTDVSFTVGESAVQQTTTATESNKDASAGSELKSPTTGARNAVAVTIVMILGLLSAAVCAIAVIARKSNMTE